MSRLRALVVGSVVFAMVPLLAPTNLVGAIPPPGDAFHGVVPARLMDTRVGGVTVDGLFAGAGAVGAGATTNVTILDRGGVPATGVGAVALNVTGVASAATFVTVWPAGETQPNASNLNLLAGIATPNMVIVKLGASGQVSLFNESGNTQLLVDVLGWFPEGDAFTGLVPARLMDTRVGGSTVDTVSAGGGPVGPGSVTDLTVLNRGGVPVDGVGAVALNVTAVGPTANSYVTVWPKGAAQPNASNLNLRAGVNIPNMVIVAVGTGGQISLFNESGNTNLIVDVLGWFPTGDSFTGLVPGRLMDTRIGGATVDGLFAGAGAVGPGSVTNVTIANRGGVPETGVGAVALNVTATGPTANSYVTVWPAGASQPNASNLNLQAGVTSPNMVIVALGAGGQISLFNESGNTNLLIDVLGWFPTTAAGSSTIRVSVDSAELQGSGGGSEMSAISADGRFVAFATLKNDLDIADTNGLRDIYLRDLVAGTTTRVSVSSAGVQTTGGDSENPAISADGRYIAYHSQATNLLGIGVDTNAEADVFVYDRVNATTVRVSKSSAGAQATGGNSQFPAISADGRYISYESAANDLVAGDTNSSTDIFLYDVVTQVTTRINVTSGGVESNAGGSLRPSMSDDGRYIAYQSFSTNLVTGDTNSQSDIFLYDRVLATTIRASVTSAGAEVSLGGTQPAISADGRYIVFTSLSAFVAGDTNGFRDIYVRDRILQTTVRVSVDSAGVEGNQHSDEPAISGDGRYVVFYSPATNLVADDTNGTVDVFVRDTVSLVTARVSVDTTDGNPNSASFHPDISNNGRFITFESLASDLVAADGNSVMDVFVRDLGSF